MKEPPICGFCGRCAALYYKRDSGKAVCFRCLSKYLQKRVKQELSNLKLPPRATIAVFVHATLHVESLTLLRILTRVERRYGSLILILYPENAQALYASCKEVTDDMMAGAVGYASSYPNDEYPSALIADFIRAAELTSVLGFRVDAIVTPLTLNDVALLALYKVFSGSNLIHELVKIARPRGILRAAHAFKGVSRADILAYAYLAGLYGIAAELPATPATGFRPLKLADVLEGMVTELNALHPELLFRLVEKLDLVLTSE